MAPSGSGKSTLLKYILGNKESDFSYNGDIYVNEIKINRRSKTLGNFCLMISMIFVLGFIGHVIPFKILKLLDNSSKLSAANDLKDDLEGKKNLLKGSLKNLYIPKLVTVPKK